MPTKDRIIFLKDNAGVFCLRDDLRSFGYDDRRRQYHVVFSNSDRTFYYNPDRVDVAEFVRQVDPPFRVTRKSGGEVFSRLLGVNVYEGRHNRAYRIIYENGEARNYPSDYLRIEEHIDDRRSLDVWEYLNEVARYNVIPVDEEKSVKLADKYDKMKFVAKDSLLEAYLNPGKPGKPSGATSAPIFPFGCNRSQYRAVRNALENRLSVIQGPPGTGKTQTILNILANLVLEGKTMEIVSNNNSAVENVKEKLDAEGLGFLCARLGRASNKSAFVDGQTGSFPDMSSWVLEDAEKVRKEAVRLSRDLQELYERQEQLAVCSERLAEYRRQMEMFPVKAAPRKKHSRGLLDKFFRLCDRDMERKHRLSWLTRTRLKLHRLPSGDDAPDKLLSMLLGVKARMLEKRIGELEDEVRDAEAMNRRLRELSMLVFRDHLRRACGSRGVRRVFKAEEIYLRSGDFLQEYPVVLSTTFSATSNINQAFRFDYLIMDEASQVDIAAGALALACARNAVIVGDLKQLPNVVDCHTREIVDAIFVKYGIHEAYRYSTNSFLSSLCRLYPDIPQTLLREHYRCDPLIIGFCSKQFYDGELIPMKRSDPEYAPIRVVKTVKGNHARGTVNLRQVETVTREILPALEERFSDIGIIAPYNGQVDALRAAMEAEGMDHVTATVHKFQGRENDAIVLSTVDNRVQEFTDDPHLLNVAVSRAKKQFTLVVSAGEQPDSNIKDLIDYIEYYQGASEQSGISSIFDLLYEDYARELVEFYRTHERVSEFDSENLTYWALREEIDRRGLKRLGILMHYPLRHLITPSSDLTEEQREYASRSWTHLDFLVYDRVSHKARLAVEVDGTRYHRAGSAQGRRDALKDSVLESIGLPLLRLSTAGSQEREKIGSALSGIRQ